MSHFSSIQTQLSDRQALATGLKTLLDDRGIQTEIEVHDRPVPLENAYDRTNRSTANVLIRRRFLDTRTRQALLDIGFLWNDNGGQFEAVLDGWDFDRNALGIEFDTVQDFLNHVQLAHDRAYIEARYPAELWNYQEQTLEDGTLRTTLTRKVDLTLA